LRENGSQEVRPGRVEGEQRIGDRSIVHMAVFCAGNWRASLPDKSQGRGFVKLAAFTASGYKDINTFHLNEGHAALLTLELLDEEARRAGRESVIQEDAEPVRNRCVFTTHTPVPAGHDKFPLDLARRVLGERNDFFGLEGVLYEGNTLNMTYLALKLSRYVNGVAQKHGEVRGSCSPVIPLMQSPTGSMPPGQFQPALRLKHSQGGAVERPRGEQEAADKFCQPGNRRGHG
jgi:hypothetical protein